MDYRKLKNKNLDKKDYLLLTKTSLSKIKAMMLTLNLKLKYLYRPTPKSLKRDIY